MVTINQRMQSTAAEWDVSNLQKLKAAIASNDSEQIRLLLSHRTEAPTSNITQSEQTIKLALFPQASHISSLSNYALHRAAISGASIQCLEIILQYAPDINSYDAQGRTALHLSSFYGEVEIVHYLLKIKDIDINKETPAGCTAVYFASYRGHAQILKSLLNAGCNPNSITKSGSSPLIVSALGGHIENVKLLLENSADPNYRNKSGSTAMHTAASNGHIEILKILISHGGDSNIHDAQGNTPADITSNRQSLLTLLPIDSFICVLTRH